jgi:hypothetical protein
MAVRKAAQTAEALVATSAKELAAESDGPRAKALAAMSVAP